MKNSIVGDKWIQDTMAIAPLQRVRNEKGEETGDLLTGPVRLSFPFIFELPKATATNNNPKYGTIILFPPAADLSILYEEYYKVAASVFPDHWNGSAYVGLHSPFHDQGEKFKYDGFTPGAVYMTVSSKFKPPVVTAQGVPVVDPAKVYAGVWAVCVLKPYSYGKNPPQPKKGPGFGLQTIMLIGDDTNLAAGGAVDPQKVFKGLAIAAPIARPDFSKLPQSPGGMPPGSVPGAALYATPPGTFPGVPMATPGMPQVIETTYRPMPPPPSAADDDDLSWMK